MMVIKKYYGIFFPDGRKEIVNNWADCQSKVKQVSNVQFKGFKKIADVHDWLNLAALKKIVIPSSSIKAYVDGSFNLKSRYAGWGFVIIDKQSIIHQAYGTTQQPAISRNIDGELEATIQAIKWAKSKNLPAITIVYDYSGIECWATGVWRAKSQVAKTYQYFMQELQKSHNLEVHFLKVKGHSGDQFNDLADQLAKKGLDELSKL